MERERFNTGSWIGDLDESFWVTFHRLHRWTGVISTERHKSKEPRRWVVVQSKVQCRNYDEAVSHSPHRPARPAWRRVDSPPARYWARQRLTVWSQTLSRRPISLLFSSLAANNRTAVMQPRDTGPNRKSRVQSRKQHVDGVGSAGSGETVL